MLPAPTTSLSVTTESLPPGALLPLADPVRPLVWLRRDAGLIGIGEAVRLEFGGPTRMADADRAWSELAGRARVEDAVGVPGTGLVAFGTFAFAEDSSRTSTLIVPRMIVGRRGDASWVTRIAVDGAPGEAPASEPVPADGYGLAFAEGLMSEDGYRSAVRSALASIEGDGLGKVVLSRELVASLPAGADLRTALERLATGYPDCWTFAVDGLIGASPETLVTSEGDGSGRGSSPGAPPAAPTMPPTPRRSTHSWCRPRTSTSTSTRS
ncbi:hypothetical protein GCM10025866_15140 [Naasia aerilata]|uniref:Chorismate-utilising enzyme C-terminal domain-containing protein n=1 Tax=Naasia aerilata TaxID=1162966 RepID=A0ABM8GBK3_9MICO|nr:hypothetical protein GCM10025866_15140 [Naasia aerilata]